MSPAARDKKLAGLRSGLAFASKERRPEIQAMIDQLLHDRPAEQPIVIETALAKEIAAPETGAAGQDGECPGAKAQTTPSAGGECVSSCLARAAGKRHCGACRKPIPVTRGGKYCSPACANAGRRAWRLAHPGANRPATRICPTCKRSFEPSGARARYCTPQCQQHRPGKNIGSAQRQGERRRREAAAREAAEAPAETRQQPIRPRWLIEWHPEVVIGPARPAPLKRYSNGVPCEFQDDLEAIADHGSPGPISRALNAPVSVSALGALVG